MNEYEIYQPTSLFLTLTTIRLQYTINEKKKIYAKMKNLEENKKERKGKRTGRQR